MIEVSLPDQTAKITELYKQYASALYRRSYSLLGNDEAHDVVQETFIRFMKAGYSKGSSFSLLYRIATNISIDRLRSRKRQNNEPIDFLNIPSSTNTEARVHNAVDLAVLTLGLKEKYFEIAVLYHVDGYSQDEVAASLGLSRRSVGTTLKRVNTHLLKRAQRLGYSTSMVAKTVEGVTLE